MSTLSKIQECFVQDGFVLSKHATDRAIIRDIRIEEIREAIATGEILEEYPDDKYGPSCLILGFTNTDRPLHIQCTHPHQSLVRIITVYQPDAEDWIEHRVRR